MSIKTTLQQITTCSMLHYYLIAVVITAVQISFFADAVDSVATFFGPYQKAIFRLGDAAVLMLPMLLLPRRCQWIQLVILWFITILELANVWYNAAYLNLMPLYSLTMVDNATSLLAGSIVEVMRPSDLLIPLPTVVITCLYCFFFRHRIARQGMSVAGRICLIIGAILLALYAQTIYSIPAYRWYTPMDKRYREVVIDLSISRLTSYDDYNRKAVLTDSGLIAWLCHFFSQWQTDYSLTDSDIREINQFFGKPLQNSNTEVSNRNLILIVVESLESWVIDYSIDGRKVCPTLSSLCRQDSTLVVRRIATQTVDGMSSDAHFMYNTGLLPMASGATANRYGGTPYPSLCKAKGEYSALAFVCDKVHFWNQGEAFRSYGYERVHDLDSLSTYADIELQGFDKVLFSYADSVLQRTPQPFIAQLVTLSMHSPYYGINDTYRSWVSDSTSLPREERNYLALTHYFDTQLGRFINNIKVSGLYDNSIIAIISDHHRPVKDAKNQYIPMIVLNADTTLHYDNVVGQIDIYPTLLDLLGAHDYAWHGLGFSILDNDAPTSAVTSRGKIYGDTTSYQLPHQRRVWPLSNKIITGRYFKTKP